MKVTLDVPPANTDATQKIQAAQAAGDLIWDGFSVMEVPWSTEEWVSRKLIQPLDDFITASTLPDAAGFEAGIIESIKEALKYDGKQYSVPGNVGSVALAWMSEPFATAGITEAPITWDEVRSASEKIYEAAPEFTPFDSASRPLTDLWSMMWGATDKPITDEGIIDITGEASIAAIEWMKGMVADDLMPATVTTENWPNWTKGATALITCFDVAATINQQTYGIDAAVNGLNMRLDKDNVAAGTPFWINSSVVLDGAKNAQGMADFLFWWFGPNNDATGKQITEVAAKPCYQYTYDKFVKDNPLYQWELDAIEVVRSSVPFPANRMHQIQLKFTGPWLEKAIAGDVEPAEAMAQALKEIQDEAAKLL